MLVVRRGAAGCRVYLPGAAGAETIAAPPVVAVDSTGAGDGHTGAFVAELHRTGSVTVTARRANAAAAIAVTRPGSATGPYRDELDRIFSGWPDNGTSRLTRQRNFRG